jgi:hypothetical protein
LFKCEGTFHFSTSFNLCRLPECILLHLLLW